MAENVLDSLQSKGLLTEDLQQKLSQIMPEEAKEKLMGIFQRYQELKDEEKDEVLNTVLAKVKQSLHEKVYSNSNSYMQFFYMHQYAIFFFAVLLIVLVLVFFVYKLFRCLSEREMKREEKKKNKQLKKKK
ncbi:uncharacterized protein LOC143183667 isoform X3 [Calliopsis andreniformis]|uniref:uncharacterized protein LOC143183667 isoform X3 n=1 Tax=Calliopsis andreniformis TaxID=337506 RepID=UPI003FCC5318